MIFLQLWFNTEILIWEVQDPKSCWHIFQCHKKKSIFHIWPSWPIRLLSSTLQDKTVWQSIYSPTGSSSFTWGAWISQSPVHISLETWIHYKSHWFQYKQTIPFRYLTRFWYMNIEFLGFPGLLSSPIITLIFMTLFSIEKNNSVW